MIFSDKLRWLKVLLIFLGLVGLVFYAQTQGPRAVPGFKEFEKNPTTFEGKNIGFNGKVLEIESENFKIEQNLDGKKKILNLQGNLKNAKVGDKAYGVFTYKKDTGMVLDRYIISNSRPFKIIFSFIALLGVAILFFKNYTFDFKKWEFKENA